MNRTELHDGHGHLDLGSDLPAEYVPHYYQPDARLLLEALKQLMEAANEVLDRHPEPKLEAAVRYARACQAKEHRICGACVGRGILKI